MISLDNSNRYVKILNPQSSILNPQSSIINPQSSILNRASGASHRPFVDHGVGDFAEAGDVGAEDEVAFVAELL